MKLFVKQKLLSFRDKYFIKDENENDVLEVKSSFFKIGKTFTLRDMQEKELFVLKQKIFHIFPHFDLVKDGEVIAKINQKFAIGRMIFNIEHTNGGKYEIRGNFRGWDFNLIKDDKMVCYISKKIVAIRDCYTIDIYIDEEMEMCVATALIMDFLCHDNRTRR